MIDTKEYVENVLFTAVQAVFPSVARLVYQKYGPPVLRRWDAVYIEHHAGNTITLDVTDQSIEEIRQTVTDALSRSAPRRPIAATDGGSGACPKCKQLITNRSPHCEWCGQAIDWRI